jgi:hypothetical protein
MLALPQYGGQCSSIFAQGLADLAYIAGQRNFHLAPFYCLNESLIPRARNTCVAYFLHSDCTHLMFIDADIGFRGKDVFELLTLQAENPEYEIIGAPYRRKSLNLTASAYCFNKYEGKIDFDPDNPKPVHVAAIGTGFMLIRRNVFEKFAAAYPEITYQPDIEPGIQFEVEPIMAYFHADIDPVSRRYLSEDYWFCARCAEIGIRTWLVPWIKLEHAGLYIFE